MYASYYIWTHPLCLPALPHSIYAPPFQVPTFSYPYSQTEVTPINQENPVRTSEESAKTSRFKYPKKNVQSNVVNQVISFLTTRAKSEPLLRKILQCQDKIQAFYEILKQTKKKNRNYMGRSVLQSLLEIDEDHPIHILHKNLKPRITLKLSQIRKALLKLTNYFLRNLIVPTLLTSSKLDKSTLNQHLLRAREILHYVNNKPYPSIL